MSYFEIENISHTFQNKKSVTSALKNISLKVETQRIVTFLGPSGSGKSTLLKILAGLETPTAGSLKGFTWTSLGFVFQEHQLLSWLSVTENLTLPFQLQRKIIDLPKIQNTLDLVSLSHAALLFPHQLSGGMKMRASIARALVSDPKLIFFDEPFSSLDELTRENLQHETRNIIKTQKMSCFFVTHSISEALFMSDEIFILGKNGELLHSEKSALSSDRNPDLRFSAEFQNEVMRLQKQFREVLL